MAASLQICCAVLFTVFLKSSFGDQLNLFVDGKLFSNYSELANYSDTIKSESQKYMYQITACMVSGSYPHPKP